MVLHRPDHTCFAQRYRSHAPHVDVLLVVEPVDEHVGRGCLGRGISYELEFARLFQALVLGLCGNDLGRHAVLLVGEVMGAVAGVYIISVVDARTRLTTHLTLSVEGGQASGCLPDIRLVHAHGVVVDFRSAT